MYYFLVDEAGHGDAKITDIPGKNIQDVRAFVYQYGKSHRNNTYRIYKAGQTKTTFVADAGRISNGSKSDITWMDARKGSYLYALNPDGSFGEKYLNRR